MESKELIKILNSPQHKYWEITNKEFIIDSIMPFDEKLIDQINKYGKITHIQNNDRYNKVIYVYVLLN